MMSAYVLRTQPLLISEDTPISCKNPALDNQRRKIFYLQSKIDSTPHSVTAPEDASTVKSYSIRL